MQQEYIRYLQERNYQLHLILKHQLEKFHILMPFIVCLIL